MIKFHRLLNYRNHAVGDDVVIGDVADVVLLVIEKESVPGD